MSIVADRSEGTALHAVLGPLLFAWASWTRLTRRHWAAAGVIALAMAAFGSITSIEQSLKMDWDAIVAMYVLNPMLSTLLFLLAWAVADAGDDRRLARRWRMAIAVGLASLASSLLAYEFAHANGLIEWINEFFTRKGKAAPGRGTILMVDTLNSLLLGGLIVAVVEVNVHRMRIQRQVENAAREQAGIARQLLESRLAAMQAQVEPQFLFDSLVDVQALYERDLAQGAGILDRLIAYLRVALPRLREAGSTVQAEVELVRAYLDVVAERHGGLPRVRFDVAADAEPERFYPMLLLPLVQRAVRRAVAEQVPPPARVSLSVRNESAPQGNEKTLVAELHIEAPGLCDDDGDIARVRERLNGLTDGLGRLDCVERQGTTQFTLRLPLCTPSNTVCNPSNNAEDVGHRSRR